MNKTAPSYTEEFKRDAVRRSDGVSSDGILFYPGLLAAASSRLCDLEIAVLDY